MCNLHEHKLPISIPVTTSYQFIAYGLAIMLAHENIKNYYYDHYVQMGFKWHSLLDSAVNPEYCPWRSGILELPVLDCAVLPVSRENAELEEICQSITDALDSGKYIYIFGLDEFYLDGSQFYQDTHILHDILIYGYDDSSNVFLKLGYNRARSFGAGETSYRGLFQALIAENAKNSFVIYTVRPHERFYLYDTEFLHREIEQYNYGVNMHRAEYFAGALSEYDDGLLEK